MKPAMAYRKWLRSRREHEGNPRNQELELELNKSMKYDDEPISTRQSHHNLKGKNRNLGRPRTFVPMVNED